MALLSDKSQRDRHRRLFARTLNDSCDLYLEQEDGSGGVETALDQQAVSCRIRTANAEEATRHGEQEADRRQFVVFFPHDADVTERHEIEFTDEAGTTHRLRVETTAGKQPHSTHLKVLATKVAG